MNALHLIKDFERLRERCIDLRILSNEFKILFSNEKKPALDAVAPATFEVLHEALIEVWWLRAGRLMDPAKTRVHDNLTFANILGRLEINDQSSNDAQEVHTQLQNTWQKMKPARDKQIAHSDLTACRQDTWLASISECEGREFEDNLQNLCDLIGSTLGVGPLDFRSSNCAGDAVDLLEFIEFGLRARTAWKNVTGDDGPIAGMYRNRKTSNVVISAELDDP